MREMMKRREDDILIKIKRLKIRNVQAGEKSNSDNDDGKDNNSILRENDEHGKKDDENGTRWDRGWWRQKG